MKKSLFLLIIVLFLIPYSRAQVVEMKVDEDNFNSALEDYITRIEHYTVHDGKLFCSYYLMGTVLSGDTLKLCVWAHVQEYYTDNGQLKEGTGSSVPELILLSAKDRFKAIGYIRLGEGERFAPSIRRNFPQEFHEQILHHKLPTDRNLSEECRKKAEAYFNLKSNN